jgi:hypothetical protein
MYDGPKTSKGFVIAYRSGLFVVAGVGDLKLTSRRVGSNSCGGLPYERAAAAAEPPVGIRRCLAMCDQRRAFKGDLCALFACSQ